MTRPIAKISLCGVVKRFGNKTVLSGIDLEVPKGCSTVIVGGSGTGKSVLLKCILGLIHPDAGVIAVDGEDATRLRGRDLDRMREKFGMLFQGGALFDSIRVWQNIAFGLTQGKGMSPKQAKPIALEKLAAVGLSADVAELFPAELSGGMQKRVALARAIATSPQTLFFDEPTTGLDPIMSDVINQLIRKCVRELGATALTITHDMASVRKIADFVAMLHDGKIVWHGPIDRIESSGNGFVDQFIHGRAEGPIQMQIRHP